jgi:hypothetical protein
MNVTARYARAPEAAERPALWGSLVCLGRAVTSDEVTTYRVAVLPQVLVGGDPVSDHYVYGSYSRVGDTPSLAFDSVRRGEVFDPQPNDPVVADLRDDRAIQSALPGGRFGVDELWALTAAAYEAVDAQVAAAIGRIARHTA